MTKRWMRIGAVLLAVSVVAAACGDDDDDAASTTTVASEDGGTTDGGGSGSCTGESDGVLHIGTVLPETGNLAFLGPPEFAGVELAVQEINEAGGVLGSDVKLSQGDSGDTSTDIANQTVDRHLEAGVDAFIGAASSGVSFTFIDKLVQNCKIHFSPANTSPDFTDYEDNGLYFRTAPSDVLQGRVLADLMIADGVTTATMIALQDPYGEGLLRYTKEPFEEQGGEVVLDFTYDPQAASYAAEVDQIVAADAEAFVLIGFEESVKILTALFEKGFTPDTKAIYLVDGNVGNSLGANFQPGQLSGIKGTLPAAEITSDFRDRLLEVDSSLEDFSYGPEAYDAVIIVALAALVAGTDNPVDIAAVMPDVTRGGTVCTSFAECAELIEAGEDIDYDGPSGPQTFSDKGEPTEASFAILAYDENNRVGEGIETEYRFAKI
jgi:ABC-type branched-subunit amino acid transport system substrate-binding protein